MFAHRIGAVNVENNNGTRWTIDECSVMRNNNNNNSYVHVKYCYYYIIYIISKVSQNIVSNWFVHLLDNQIIDAVLWPRQKKKQPCIEREATKTATNDNNNEKLE